MSVQSDQVRLLVALRGTLMDLVGKVCPGRIDDDPAKVARLQNDCDSLLSVTGFYRRFLPGVRLRVSVGSDGMPDLRWHFQAAP